MCWCLTRRNVCMHGCRSLWRIYICRKEHSMSGDDDSIEQDEKIKGSAYKATSKYMFDIIILKICAWVSEQDCCVPPTVLEPFKTLVLELTPWSIRTCRIRNCKNIRHYWRNE
ncbi:hypothetical protein JB92DRAFT_2846703 [Gautieria morchelliformis]|nr:hypothetical protein JB92DRAFT_2846703 [Gautieria morchelliformis]